ALNLLTTATKNAGDPPRGQCAPARGPNGLIASGGRGGLSLALVRARRRGCSAFGSAVPAAGAAAGAGVAAAWLAARGVRGEVAADGVGPAGSVAIALLRGQPKSSARPMGAAIGSPLVSTR